jgi:hypothetical protein
MSDHNEHEPMTVEAGTLALLAKSEIDMQIATAHKFPRSVTRFRKEAMELVTLDSATANECSYALPRDGKVITGPSARFAEIIASCWGNMRAGARVVDDTGKFIVAQGVCHDLERNVAITFEVQRRVTDKNARRYKDDMIGVTGNAASSIALRNAILKVIPKALWAPMYDEALRVIKGDIATLATRRDQAMQYVIKLGVVPESVFAVLGVSGIDDIGLDELVVLKGLCTAIKDGETNIDQAFPSVRAGADALNDKLKAEPEGDKPEATDAPAAKRAAKKKPAADKPPTQTVSGASVGDQAQMGTPGVETASAPAPSPTPAAAGGDPNFNLE